MRQITFSSLTPHEFAKQVKNIVERAVSNALEKRLSEVDIKPKTETKS